MQSLCILVKDQVKQRLSTLLCTLSVLHIGWASELTASFPCLSAHPGLARPHPAPPPPHPVLPPPHPPRQCSVTCGEGIQQRQVVCRTNANSLGQCEGAKPDTVQACSLPACGGEPGRMGVGQLLWPRSEAQPDWLPSPLVPPVLELLSRPSQEISRTPQ